jgi:hypothetical protein
MKNLFKDRRNWPALLLLCTILAIWSVAVAQQGNQVIPVSGGGGAATVSTNYTLFPTTGGTTLSTYSPTGTTYVALNNLTGTVDFSGPDAGVVIRAAFAAKIATCGEMDFKSGIYNINSLVQETTGGFSQYNGILIPAIVTANQYCQWKIHGEMDTPAIDQFTTPAGTTGVIFNITPTAVSSVAGGSVIFGIWARPDVANGVGTSVWGDNFDVRVPTNQRGNETAIDLTQALNVHLVNVTVDTAVAQINLALPVAGGSGLYGITSTASVKEENYFEHDFAIGYNVCFDIQGEHTQVNNSFALQCNHGWDIGVRGTAQGVVAPQVYVQSGCAETIRCLTLGADLQTGTLITIDSWTFEDQALGNTFSAVYHALETNSGGSFGLMSYDNSLEGGNTANGYYTVLPNPFDGGGGQNFTTISRGSARMNQLPGNDTFARLNYANLGAPWIATPLGGGHLSIISNAAAFTATGAQQTDELYAGSNFNNDQFAQMTVSTIDASASTNAAIEINGLTTATTGYFYYCSNAAATGSGISKEIAGASTVLASQTAVSGCAAGNVISIRRVTLPNGNVLLYAYKNGVLDTNFAPNPVTESVSKLTGGYPGMQLTQDATSGIAVTNFIGGNQPTFNGTDTIYTNAFLIPSLISTGAAPTITGTGACLTNSTQVGGGDLAGKITCTAATAASTLTITFVKGAPSGYSCSLQDQTTAQTMRQTSTTTTTCVWTFASVTQNDVMVWSAIAY